MKKTLKLFVVVVVVILNTNLLDLSVIEKSFTLSLIQLCLFFFLWSYQEDHSVESIYIVGYWLLMFLVSFLCISTEPIKINVFIRRFLESHPVKRKQLT